VLLKNVLGRLSGWQSYIARLLPAIERAILRGEPTSAFVAQIDDLEDVARARRTCWDFDLAGICPLRQFVRDPNQVGLIMVPAWSSAPQWRSMEIMPWLPMSMERMATGLALGRPSCLGDYAGSSFVSGCRPRVRMTADLGSQPSSIDQGCLVQATSYWETLTGFFEFCGCSPAYLVPAMPSGLNADPGAEAELPGVVG
jgi:hypothetical protein